MDVAEKKTNDFFKIAIAFLFLARLVQGSVAFYYQVLKYPDIVCNYLQSYL